MIEALADGKFDTEAFVTDRIPLADIVSDGYERLMDPETEHVKIPVEPLARVSSEFPTPPSTRTASTVDRLRPRDWM